MTDACSVCFESESWDENKIMFCDNCDVGVHQDCYAISSVPEGEWLCRKCSKTARPVECKLCPMQNGAFGETTCGGWSHIVCALYLQAKFRDPDHLSMIDVGPVDKARFSRLRCSICHVKRGACIQCSYKKCAVGFHVTCAYMPGYRMESKEAYTMRSISSKRKFDDVIFQFAYCPKHRSYDMDEQKVRLTFETQKERTERSAQKGKQRPAQNNSKLTPASSRKRPRSLTVEQTADQHSDTIFFSEDEQVAEFELQALMSLERDKQLDRARLQHLQLNGDATGSLVWNPFFSSDFRSSGVFQFTQGNPGSGRAPVSIRDCTNFLIRQHHLRVDLLGFLEQIPNDVNQSCLAWQHRGLPVLRTESQTVFLMDYLAGLVLQLVGCVLSNSTADTCDYVDHGVIVLSRLLWSLLGNKGFKSVIERDGEFMASLLDCMTGILSVKNSEAVPDEEWINVAAFNSNRLRALACAEIVSLLHLTSQADVVVRQRGAVPIARTLNSHPFSSDLLTLILQHMLPRVVDILPAYLSGDLVVAEHSDLQVHFTLHCPAPAITGGSDDLIHGVEVLANVCAAFYYRLLRADGGALVCWVLQWVHLILQRSSAAPTAILSPQGQLYTGILKFLRRLLSVEGEVFLLDFVENHVSNRRDFGSEHSGSFTMRYNPVVKVSLKQLFLRIARMIVAIVLGFPAEVVNDEQLHGIFLLEIVTDDSSFKDCLIDDVVPFFVLFFARSPDVFESWLARSCKNQMFGLYSLKTLASLHCGTHDDFRRSIQNTFSRALHSALRSDPNSLERFVTNVTYARQFCMRHCTDGEQLWLEESELCRNLVEAMDRPLASTSSEARAPPSQSPNQAYQCPDCLRHVGTDLSGHTSVCNANSRRNSLATLNQFVDHYLENKQLFDAPAGSGLARSTDLEKSQVQTFHREHQKKKHVSQIPEDNKSPSKREEKIVVARKPKSKTPSDRTSPHQEDELSPLLKHHWIAVRHEESHSSEGSYWIAILMGTIDDENVRVKWCSLAEKRTKTYKILDGVLDSIPYASIIVDNVEVVPVSEHRVKLAPAMHDIIVDTLEWSKPKDSADPPTKKQRTSVKDDPAKQRGMVT